MQNKWKSENQQGMQAPPSANVECGREVEAQREPAGACGFSASPIHVPFAANDLQQQFAWPPMPVSSSPPLLVDFGNDSRHVNDPNQSRYFLSDVDDDTIVPVAGSTPKAMQMPGVQQPLKPHTATSQPATEQPSIQSNNDMESMRQRIQEMQKAMDAMMMQQGISQGVQAFSSVFPSVNVPASSTVLPNVRVSSNIPVLPHVNEPVFSTMLPNVNVAADFRRNVQPAPVPLPEPIFSRPIPNVVPQSRACSPGPVTEPVNTRQYATLTDDGSTIVIVHRNAAGEQYAELVPVMNAAAVPATRAQSESQNNYFTCVDRSATLSPMSSIRKPVDQQHFPEQRSYENNGYGTRSYQQRRIYDLPTFSGQPEEWPMFSNAFVTTTEAFAYTSLENLMRLQKALTGEAKRSVECLLIHPSHINEVMTTLEATFGRPELLVRSQIEIARRLPSITESRLEQLGPFSVKVKNLAIFLDTEETRHHLANPMLLDELVGKLPMSRRMDWAGVAIRILPHPTVRDFARWLAEVARLVNLVALPTTGNTEIYKPDGVKSQQTTRSKHVLLNVENNCFEEISAEEISAAESCVFCQKSHNPGKCDVFLRMTAEDRWKEVTRLRVCFTCLRPGHIIPTCSERVQCGVDNCLMWHHPTLHSESTMSSEPSSRTVPVIVNNSVAGATKKNGRNRPRRRTATQQLYEKPNDRGQASATGPTSSVTGASPCLSNATQSILNCIEGKVEMPFLFRIVPVVLYGRERSLNTYALLDEGSSLTMVDADVADQLQLEGPSTDLNVQWFGSLASRFESSRKVSVGISGATHTDQRFDMHNVRTVQNITLPTQTVDAASLQGMYPHLRHVPIAGFENVAPKILIGLDNHHLGVPLKMETNAAQTGIVAALTKLGWVVYGSDTRQSTSPPAVLLHISSEQERQYAELAETVRTYFTTEDFGVKKPEAIVESDEDIRARRLLKSTTKRIDDHFETGLLWRTDTVNFPNSYNMALRRLTGVESKMRRDPNYASQYQEQINSYIAKGYARKLSKEEAQQHDSRTWYLPHFAVQNPNKPGKFRLVFDAAATVRGVSLNSELLSGPDVNVPLTKMLFRFRLGLVGICGDIREMFHQVRIRKEDQNSQRFLWREGNGKSDPNTYVMEAMTFGSTCSPASAQFVKNLNAAEFADMSPAAADAIQRNHYVDDYVASFATPEQAAEVTKAVVDIHRRGGFELRGFVCNDQSVLNALGVEVGSNQPVNLEPTASTNTEKILGMNWDTETDCFLFATRFSRVNPDVVSGAKNPTKREILSASMSVFDPFGFLAEFMLAAKLILQDLWGLDVGWDQPVPNVIKVRWQAWCAQIERTHLCRIPRCYSSEILNSPDLQLHVFADASEVAFAAVAYWRVVSANGEVDLAFIAGKTKCAPLKILTIPRLELQAAVLATRLVAEIRECHELPIAKVVLWTDSRTILHWIRSDQRKYKPFVAFRVAEIIDSTDPSWWRWLPTTMNADV